MARKSAFTPVFDALCVGPGIQMQALDRGLDSGSARLRSRARNDCKKAIAKILFVLILHDSIFHGF
jgi:hypothetical protein